MAAEMQAAADRRRLVPTILFPSSWRDFGLLEDREKEADKRSNRANEEITLTTKSKTNTAHYRDRRREQQLGATFASESRPALFLSHLDRAGVGPKSPTGPGL
ncbi:Hypothetical predicted protein [Xyrichtys novacula]|uniref:Uncharacterized protein n=1 Tax=Xyrichtys novacula TaxID=13765 RepID=A0AAV1H7K4_XYRNO|nr:Hypothetical predicted protein [Xyrichtys novacula]